MTYCPLDLVESFMARFVVFPSEHARVAVTLWCAHTHLLDHFETTPRLAFMSAEPQSGKSRAMEIAALFVPNPRMSFSMSAASMVRIIAKGHEEGRIPVVFYDEIDCLFSKNEEGTSDLRGALNAGYRRGAVATRCINQGAGIVDFQCFAAVALAGLKTLPDALATRTIFIHMRPRAGDELIDSYRLRYHPAEAKPIMQALEEWCAEIDGKLTGYEPNMPEAIVDRAADIWEPLIAIADMAGDDWTARATAAAIYLTGAAKDDIASPGVELLAHVQEAFLNADKIWAATLCQRLCDREESPWADIRGRPLDPRMLAVRLKPYRIRSRDIRIDGLVRKGYRREDFHDAWKRFLPSATSATSATFLDNNNNSVADVAGVADSGPEKDHADFEERAAILEYDGGLTREEAEARAAEEYPDLPTCLDRRKAASS